MTDKSGFNLSKQGANIVRKEFRRQLVLLAMGSAMVPFSGAMAQSDESGITAEQSRASSAHSGASQPAIVVTARRKEESILETPLAVSAFSADDIADAGLQDFNDIFLFAPGVYNSNVTGRSDRITIRGVSQVSTTGGSNAGVFVDGVYVSGPVTALELDNLERVEVVKGPQSTQFGRGTLAGAVNYVTRRPSDTWEGQVKVTAATLDEYSASGYVSGPLNDNFSFLAGGGYFNQDSLFYNAYENRKDMGGKESYSGTFGLRFKSSVADIYLRATYSESKADPIGIYTQGPEFNNCNLSTPRQYYCGVINIDYNDIKNITRAIPAPAGSTGQYQYPGSRGSEGYVGGEAGTDRESLRIALITNLDFDSTIVQLISSYQTEDERWGSDATNRAVVSSPLLPNGGAVDISRDWEDFSQEIRVRRSFGDFLELTVGGYFFTSDRNETATYIPEDRGTYSEENLALLGAAEFTPVDWLTVTGEVRTQRDQISLHQGTDQFRAVFKATLPRVTIDVTPMQGILLYGVYARGNKPGSFNTRIGLPSNLIPIDEESIETWEIGVKGSVFDNRLQFALAAYTMDWDNQQLTQQCSPPTCAVAMTYTDNVGRSKIQGFEAEAAMEIIPDFWNVQATAAYNHGEIKSYEVVGSGSEVAEALGFGFPATAAGALVSGTPLPGNPKWTFSLTNTLTGDITDDWGWFFRGDYSWVGEQFASIYGQASSGSRELLNLRAGVMNEDWKLELFATNVTQDRSPVSVLRTVRFDAPSYLPIGAQAGIAVQRSFSAILQEPRQFGLSVTKKF